MNDDLKSGTAAASTRAELVKLHDFEHWPARWIWPLLIGMLVLGAAASEASIVYWPLLFIIWPVLSGLMFVFVLAFHDASHGRLHPVHSMNEMIGHVMGTVMLTPLSVYRYAHARHHAQLARPGDPELWPFNMTTVSRPLRILAAIVEIFLGAFYTPLLFLRSVLVGTLTPRERRLIVRGYVGCAVAWIAILVIVYDFDLWRLLIVSMIVPMLVSGTLQTLNKYEQHIGLHGHTVLGLTRTVIDQHKLSEMVSAAMLYNDYHGTHHRYAKIPYYHLPYATPYTVAGASEYCPVYPNVFSATVDMLRCLADPKVGPQWNVEISGDGSSSGAKSESVPIAQPVFTGGYES